MTFEAALVSGLVASVQAFPKSDLHNHAGRGGSQATVSKWVGHAIVPPSGPFADLDAMQAWFDAEVKALLPPGLEGYLKRIKAAFIQAQDDGVALLAMSFAYDEVRYLGGMQAFVQTIDALHRAHAPGVRFMPELSFSRADDPAQILSWLDEILAWQWFASVDICGDELAAPVTGFVPVYRQAAQHGLRLKAHVGEFGTADDVVAAVEALSLHEVHHGIAAATSPSAMRWLRDHRIRLNICPTSNLLLGRAVDYARHPIAALYRAGVPVTIGSDDQLIFGQSVSDEYLNLYRAGTLTARELNDIHHAGLVYAP